jgi:hypothetical protein
MHNSIFRGWWQSSSKNGPETKCIILLIDLHLLFVPFSAFWGDDVRREFMQRFYAALHGTLGSYLRDALHAGACLHIPRAWVFPSFLIFAWWSPMLFLV